LGATGLRQEEQGGQGEVEELGHVETALQALALASFAGVVVWLGPGHLEEEYSGAHLVAVASLEKVELTLAAPASLGKVAKVMVALALMEVAGRALVVVVRESTGKAETALVAVASWG
jgi:hypothetical protein